MYKSGLAIWYNVSDLERTLAFYTDALGFELVFRDDESGMAIVNTNTADCCIGFSRAEAVVPATSNTVFEVEDIESAVDTLQGRGVVFDGEIETIPDFVRLATFRDPDGHGLELSQTLMSFE